MSLELLIATDEEKAEVREALGLGSAATSAATMFATAAQGSKADTALQPIDGYADTAALVAAITAMVEQKVSMVATVPTTPGDFSMFDGESAPSTGVYIATNRSAAYIFSAGWTTWVRWKIANFD